MRQTTLVRLCSALSAVLLIVAASPAFAQARKVDLSAQKYRFFALAGVGGADTGQNAFDYEFEANAGLGFTRWLAPSLGLGAFGLLRSDSQGAGAQSALLGEATVRVPGRYVSLELTGGLGPAEIYTSPSDPAGTSNVAILFAARLDLDVAFAGRGQLLLGIGGQQLSTGVPATASVHLGVGFGF